MYQHLKIFVLLIAAVGVVMPASAQLDRSLRRGNYRNHRTQPGQPARTVKHSTVRNAPTRHQPKGRSKRHSRMR